MRWYREFIPRRRAELNGFFAFLTVPPVPPFPEALHLKKMCGVVWCYTGPAEQAEKVFAPMRAFGPPALDGVAADAVPGAAERCSMRCIRRATSGTGAPTSSTS